MEASVLRKNYHREGGYPVRLPDGREGVVTGLLDSSYSGTGDTRWQVKARREDGSMEVLYFSAKVLRRAARKATPSP